MGGGLPAPARHFLSLSIVLCVFGPKSPEWLCTESIFRESEVRSSFVLSDGL